MEGLLNCWYVFIGNVVARCSILKLATQVSLSIFVLRLCRLHVTDHLSVLASTSTLLLMKVIELDLLADCLSVVYCGVTYVKIDFILSLHSLAIHKQVELTHP